VDLLTCLNLPMDQIADAHFQNVTLKEYVAVMINYLSRFRDQQAAETMAATRAEQALRLAPRAHSKSRGFRP
jgi:hypothetical protein